MNVVRILIIVALLFALKVLFIDGGAGGIAGGEKSLIEDGLLPLDVQYLQGPTHVEGRPVLLEFWATWCGPCVQSIPHLNQLYAQHRERGLQVIGVTNESANVVRQFMQQHPMRYAVALDEKNTLHSAFRVRGIPQAHLFDSDGRRVWHGHPQSLTSEILDGVL